MMALRILAVVVGLGLLYVAPCLVAVRPGVPASRVRWAQRAMSALGAACLVLALS